MGKPRNVAVIGLDAFNRNQLETLRMADRYSFEELLSYDEIKGEGGYSFEGALQLAEDRLAGGEVSRPDGVATFWDFPATSLVAVLADRLELPGPTLESTLKCEHKYWSRHEQAKVTETCPPFQALDPFAADAIETVEIEYPFWIKPVKGAGSYLAFKVRRREELEAALEKIREGIQAVAEPFNRILSRAQLPPEIAPINGQHCVLEGMLEGSQHTVSGFVHAGEVSTYGVVDSLNYPDSSSFLCYEYPSLLPATVQERMSEAARAVIAAIGLDQSPFNIEFFYDDRRDHLGLLEINPRVSQSHTEIYRKVDGDSNEEIAVQVALGEKPVWRRRKGGHPVAGKFYVRRFHDGFVHRVPLEADLAALNREEPEVVVEIAARAGKRLSEDHAEDSYSFDLAHVHLGAESHEALHRRFESIRARLPFEIEEVRSEADG